MDKQYKLTDRVSKDSIKSPIFNKWVKRILCLACILSLSLQFAMCVVPMFASAEDSIVGTWVFNDNISMPDYYAFQMEFTVDSIEYDRFYFNRSAYQLQYREVSSGIYIDVYNNGWLTDTFKTITITSDTVVYLPTNEDISENIKTWLKANATKVVETVYDFTGETRIFNDELTLFNTADATFTYAFNFNFDVLGVGTADYITLQRTAQNNYTMSYAFDFEGSGGLTMIYRDSPPFNDDEAEWLGGKVNRKVITFLSNPDDPEFQQWLLDNTTLFDNVNDAYLLGQQSGYNNGYEEGFANSLIGDTLSGPINALSQITLIEIQGTAITLGGVVMTAIALCLVLAFLKLYAGG